MKEKKFFSYDGSCLHEYAFEIKEPKAIVQIVHGLQENCKLYFNFAKFLNKNGFNVYMLDQRAHGKSVERISQIGISCGDIFSQSVADQLFFTSELVKQKELPIYLIGHSYGSFVCQSYLKKNQFAQKVVLLGTTYTNSFLFKAGKILAKSAIKFVSPNKRAFKAETKIYRIYNKKFKQGNWVVEDDETWKVLSADKTSHIPFSYGFYASMFSGITQIYKNINSIDKSLPILVASGKEDALSGFGKGISKLAKVYQKHKLNAKFIFYPNARHNLLFSASKNQVYQDILNFLQK